MFKKIQKFYKNNRIYCILMFISAFCILLMGVSVVVYFVHQMSTSNYGARLEKIDDYELGTTLSDLESYYKEQEGVISASVRLQGKIIYVNVEANPDLKNEQLQNIATSSLEKISDENKSFYDIQFIFKRANLNAYFGSKNSSNTIITWSNFSYDTETTTTTEKK